MKTNSRIKKNWYHEGKRHCPLCKEIKELNVENFYSIPTRHGGYSAYCRKCSCIIQSIKNKRLKFTPNHIFYVYNRC